MKQVGLFMIAVLLGGAMMLGSIHYFDLGVTQKIITQGDATPVQFAINPDVSTGMKEAIDFTQAADRSLPAVVHIRSSVRMDQDLAAQPFDFRQLPDPFRDFFGQPRQRQQGQQQPLRQGSGSGVIISSDGYIVTNNHVVDHAETIEVTLNDKRTYEAEVIGVDPSTDIAVIKIDDEALPYLQFANSDEVKVGEWAVAVGNPFNLASTVTAGIVSAKGRNIRIMRDRAPIESFIQTDAAVNPGNSGGALVNLKGDLIGINTAIASPTGAYSGYAFAVPSNIVYKVVTDLKTYGVVQRGFIGALIRDVDQALAESQNLDVPQGVYVDSLTANSSAAEAGMIPGDIVIEVDGIETPSSSVLLEMIGRHRPGDVVTMTVLRQGDQLSIPVTLKNRTGNTEIVAKDDRSTFSKLGADFANLTDAEKAEYRIQGGVKVTEVNRGKLRTETGIKPGFIITKINRQTVNDVESLGEALAHQQGGVMLEGFYPGDPQARYYAFGL